MADRAIAGYAAAAEALTARYSDLDPNDLYARVMPFFPPAPARVLDIGAGPGRDAGWLAAKGHVVTAVEPVAGFRAAGQARFGAGIAWVEDRLPGPEKLQGSGAGYDLILASGVWHHLEDGAQARAMRGVAELLAAGGRLILSLRHGPGAPTRPKHPCDPDLTTRRASARGLHLLHRHDAPSLQGANIAACVRWDWLVFAHVGQAGTRAQIGVSATPAIG